MKSPFLVLNTAIANRIEADTGREVLGSTPENETFPYIMMGALDGRDWSDKFCPGQEVFSTVHSWSQYAGKEEILKINDEILQAVTRAPLDLGSVFNAVFVQMDGNRIIDDIDGFTLHGILTFKFLIEER